ncbi:MAG: metal-dependent hydrolase [Candidatus Pseudobacter hemicellulosilyticus]|uniref:Metal-dependent hydrolase n=1 Tax=Candidatus Pseudobacter hemicellulosilyticus TaxID=3121375 RepID=A0AAJ5WVJ2_9BACT|nr:MAG: metal-dependent hydrolase [Pseudobacter sp.]
MDSLTHIVVGACIGDAMAGKQIGKKAMFWGALMQSLPDIDFVASFWMNPVNDLLAHRGFTHSFLFIILVTPLIALIAERWHRPHDISLKKWLLFFGVEMAVHVLLDGMNAYGTGWLEPFSHHRFAFHILFVADPLFSIWPAITFVLLLIWKNNNPKRRKYVFTTLGLCAAYLLLGVVSKTTVDSKVKTLAARQGITYQRYLSTPTPLNNLLWYVVLEDKKGYHLAYRSLLDKTDSIHFQYFSRNEELLAPITDLEDAHRLVRFSQGYYTIERWNNTLMFNDLRFGQMIGWRDREAGFVFHYYLQKPEENALVIQRGRFSNWDREAMLSLLRRIAGTR